MTPEQQAADGKNGAGMKLYENCSKKYATGQNGIVAMMPMADPNVVPENVYTCCTIYPFG
ncbi:hypothetical protein [Pedobacter steynii]